MFEDLPWSRWPWNRCAARRERQSGDPDWGRCELQRHGPEIDHALERGMGLSLRWSTRWTSGDGDALRAGDTVSVLLLSEGLVTGTVEHLGNAVGPLTVIVNGDQR